MSGVQEVRPAHSIELETQLRLILCRSNNLSLSDHEGAVRWAAVMLVKKTNKQTGVSCTNFERVWVKSPGLARA